MADLSFNTVLPLDCDSEGEHRVSAVDVTPPDVTPLDVTHPDTLGASSTPVSLKEQV